MKKKSIINLIHINFWGGFSYAFVQFLTTPRLNILSRRMWAYECWIIFGFYAIFLALLLREKTADDKVLTISKIKGRLGLSLFKAERNDTK